MERLILVLIKKYSRRVLTRMEEKGLSTPELRKFVLDGFNDLGRELLSKKL